MRGTGVLQLPWQRASELINGLLPNRPRSRSLLEFLLREGLLTEVHAIGAGENADQIRFGFERLGEYLFVVRALKDVQPGSLNSLFADGGALHLNHDLDSSGLQGLAEALAVLLPERSSVELPDLSSPLSRRQALTALVCSLPWRHPGSFTSRTEELMREALETPEVFEQAMEELVSLAARAQHPIGASFFDKLMREKAQPGRDAIMCGFLHRNWERGGPVRRLSHWAVRPDLGLLSNETALDWAQTLLWFCLAADRRIRDWATMGVVALMQRHPDCLPQLLGRLRGVDDEYVTERYLLAAYGALIRSGDSAALAECASMVWNQFFSGSAAPTLNAMIRDHGRCIIEMAVARGVLASGIDLARCRPPYRSPWPSQPTLERSERGSGQGPDQREAAPVENEGPAMRKLRYSVEHDDFAVYTMDSALGSAQRPTLDLKAAQQWILQEVDRMGFTGERFDRYDGYMLGKYGGGRARPSWAEPIGKKYQWIALYRLAGLVGDHIPSVKGKWGTLEPATAAIPLQVPGERNVDPTMLLSKTAATRKPTWWAPVEIDFREGLSEDKWLDSPVYPDSLKLIDVVDPLDHRRWLVLRLFADWDNRKGDNDWNEIYRSCWMHIRSYFVKKEEYEKAWHWLRRQDFHGAWMPEGAHWLPYVFAGEYPWSVQAQYGLAVGGWDRPSDIPFNMIPTALDQVLEFDFDAYHEEKINLILPDRRFFDGTSLRWDGLGGYLDSKGQSAFRLPSLTEGGPQALLVDKQWLERWLEEHKLRIVWAVLSEQRRMGELPKAPSRGHTVHSRAHRLNDGGLQSSRGLTHRHRPSDPSPRRRSSHTRRR